jgi:hypothetical protein
MFLLVFALVEGHGFGWPLWIAGMIGAGVAVLATFARHQVRRRRAGRTPLIEPSIFARRAYTCGLLFSLVFVGSLGGIILILNVLLQAGLGFSPWHSALTTAPWAAGAFVGSAAGGISMAKHGRRVLHAGLVVETVGLVAIYGALRASGAHVATADLLGPMVLGGIGMGMVFVPLFDIVMAGVEPYQMGSAAGVLQSVNGLAMALGVAGLGIVFFDLVRTGGVGRFLSAGQWTALATAGLLASAFVIAFWLPRHARAPHISDTLPASASVETAHVATTPAAI